MTRYPIDPSVRVSPKLSALIEMRTSDPDVEQPITLADLREYLSNMLSDSFREAEHMHRFDVTDSVLDELNMLMGEYGGHALAEDFLKTSASEPLSRVIETVIDDENRESPPTLAEVQEEMLNGLVTRLVGEGVLEEDEDDALLSEMETLIGRYGPDSLAEDLLRYE